MPQQNRISDWRSALHDSEAMIGEHPLSSVLVTFGVGFGIGLVIGSALSESLAPHRELTLSEKVSQQVLDALHHSLPQALGQRLPN